MSKKRPIKTIRAQIEQVVFTVSNFIRAEESNMRKIK